MYRPGKYIMKLLSELCLSMDFVELFVSIYLFSEYLFSVDWKDTSVLFM